MPGQAFEVLNRGDEQEFVPGSGKASQSEPDPREGVFDLGKERLDCLAYGA